MNFKIIELELMHLNACVDLDQKSLNGLWSKSQWEKELTDSKRICLGAIDHKTNKLLGLCCAWLLIDEIYITSIAIYPSHQRKGLGKMLLSELVTHSRSIKTKQIYLEVKDTNESAKAFYKSMGFKIAGNRSNFYKDESNAIIFIKQLSK